MEMAPAVNPEQRKIVKAKKRVTVNETENKLYDEEGNELEFEADDVEEEVDEDVIQRDDGDDDGW